MPQIYLALIKELASHYTKGIKNGKDIAIKFLSQYVLSETLPMKQEVTLKNKI